MNEVTHRSAARSASPTLRAALGAVLLLACAGDARAAGHQNSFGVPESPQAPPGQTPGYPQQPGFPQPNYGPAPQPGFPPAPQTGNGPAQQPRPGPQQPAMSVEQYLVSTWQGQTQDDTGSWNVMVVFRPDSTFMQAMILNNGQFQLAMMGRFTAQLGPEGGVITLNPQQWNPQQVCNGGQCQPLKMPSAIQVRFKPLGRDQIQLEDGALQRVGPPT